MKTRSARCCRCTKRAAKSLRSKRLFSQGCEVGFHLEVLSFQLLAYIGQLLEGIHNTVQKGCEIISQQKGDFATLCKILPTTWSNRLAMLVTPSFQLRIMHRLKHWFLTSWALKWYIACRKWTSGSAPKVWRKTATTVLCFLHSLFASLLCFSPLLGLS